MSKTIRQMHKEDYYFVEEISKATWDGEDYIHNAFHSWLKDGHFYALEIDGRVAGTVKLTILPDGVGWLEGLRVHPDYRGMGYGRELHEFIVTLGRKLVDMGEIKTIEFATHLLNTASRKMAEKSGFKVVKKFYFAYREADEPMDFEKSKISTLDEIWYREYIPYGWKFLHGVEDTVDWLNRNAGVGETHGVKFIYPLHDTEPSFFPLDISERGISSIIRAISSHALKTGKKNIATMVPENKRELLSLFIEHGFQSMVDFSEADVLIFRLIF